MANGRDDEHHNHHPDGDRHDTGAQPGRAQAPSGRTGAPAPQHGWPAGPDSSPYGTSPYGASPYGTSLYEPAPDPHFPAGPAGAGGYLPVHRPGVVPLRPLALADILEGSFALIRRNAAAVLGSVLLLALLQLILLAVSTIGLTGSLSEVASMPTAQQNAFFESPPAGALGGLVVFLAGSLLSLLVFLVGTTVLQGVVGVVAVRAAAGLKTGLSRAWRLTGRQVWSLIALALLYALVWILVFGIFGGIIVAAVVQAASTTGSGVAAALGLALLVLIPAAVVIGVWISVKLVAAPAVVAVEQRGPFRAIARSWSLTSRNFWRTFGILLLVTVIVTVVASVITVPFSLLGGLATPFADPYSVEQMIQLTTGLGILSVVANTLVQALATAFLVCIIAALYVDYRIRREGFELDVADAATRAGHVDEDTRFSTVQDSGRAADTDELVPGRYPRSTAPPGPGPTAR